MNANGIFGSSLIEELTCGNMIDLLWRISASNAYLSLLQHGTGGDKQMSERQEKKRRYNQNLEYIADFNRWLNEEPPLLRFVSWHKWKKSRPKRRTK